MDGQPPAIVTQEIRIVDDQGNARLLLSAKSGVPVIQMLRPDGEPGLAITLDQAGRPSIKLANPATAAPSAALEIDDKGAHVKFDRPGGASSYLFLNNFGAAGVVLLDTKGVRRLNVLTASDGTASVERFGPDGKPSP
ncbi:hypothetical protein ONR75_03370 [Rhodopseudomonas sp. P2A-2r]|uniref:hypothetical protein n=1 Tax=Rhodopseudomonas sp. P2A-2r TaxID=2991972 RepID=UPI0022343C16|nr:hypothetical protein [Rhodopseudomonas sp. P2A-2r]UZE49848.1 hypothetical protein ONR75_03370 [Rhodopseudomonas sp. P2A-2r]